jgi:ribosome-dependent ATPase
MHSSLGAYTKGLAPGLMLQDLVFLAACIPVLYIVSALLLRKQEK